MATLNVTTMGRAGADFTALSQAAAGGGDKFANTGAEFLVINNGSGSPITLTLVLGTGGTVDGLTPAAKTVSVLAGHTFLVGPFPVGFYNDATGFVNFTYSGVTSLTVAAIKPGT